MYYKDVTLFGSQNTVDRLVDDIAATMSVSRSDLFVVSALSATH
jgi:meiotic recombination protein SPO11